MSAYDRAMRQAAKQSAAGHGIASFFSRTKKPPAASKSTPPPVEPTYSSVVVNDAGREEQAHRQFELLAKDFKGHLITAFNGSSMTAFWAEKDADVGLHQFRVAWQRVQGWGIGCAVCR